MVDETNAWLAQPDVQEKLDHLAERFTHKKEECLEKLCSLASGSGNIHMASVISVESGGLSSLDYTGELGRGAKVFSETSKVAANKETA